MSFIFEYFFYKNYLYIINNNNNSNITTKYLYESKMIKYISLQAVSIGNSKEKHQVKGHLTVWPYGVIDWSH